MTNDARAGRRARVDETQSAPGAPRATAAAGRAAAREGEAVEYNLTIKDLPESERPRERLANYGANAVSTAELMAIILRTGTADENVLRLAQRLLHDSNGLAGLAQAPLGELTRCKGIGPAKAVELRAAFDTKNHVLKVHTVYIGSLNSAQVRVGELFREAIRTNSAALIVAHNHPSGDPTPSPEDVAVTRQIVEAGKLLDIDVLDHLVIGLSRWVSLKERGLGF